MIMKRWMYHEKLKIISGKMSNYQTITWLSSWLSSRFSISAIVFCIGPPGCSRIGFNGSISPCATNSVNFDKRDWCATDLQILLS